MSLDALLAAFPPDGDRPSQAEARGAFSDVAAFTSAVGGLSLAGGLYRVFTAAESREWSATACDVFPELRDRVSVFAADWLGRLFAADAGRLAPDGSPMVLLLEPGTCDVLELPVTLEALHATELVDASDAALAAPFYRQWRSDSGDTKPLSNSECVGYRVPLFLGGKDSAENLERTDMSVYWELVAQMREQTLGMEPGVQVDAVSIERPNRGLFRRRG